MAKRLFLMLVVATLWACKGGGILRDRGDAREGRQAAGDLGHDAIERGLMALGIEGRTLRLDLNAGKARKDRVRLAKVHLTPDQILLETEGSRPRLYALDRGNFSYVWVSELREPSKFPATTNGDVIVILTEHYAHCLSKQTGSSTIRFTHGAMADEPRPFLKLPFSPTGGAAVGNDTFYCPSLGSTDNNKNLESFSMISGQRGWGYRTPGGDILSTPVVGGDAGDPKLYFVTTTGLVTCLDATNYAYTPRGARWQEMAESPVPHGLTVTADTRERSGGVYFADEEGVVYCLNRLTGDRRWVSATARRPVATPVVYGDFCVVKMAGGLTGFDAVNVIYGLQVEGGADDGQVFWLRGGQKAVLGSGGKSDFVVHDASLGRAHLSLQVSGELLTCAALGEERTFRVNDGTTTRRAPLRAGDRIYAGNTVLRVLDRGTEALWHDLPYDEIVAAVADTLVARKGTALQRIDRWTGRPEGEPADLPGARIIPANVQDANLFVVGGDAVVYAFLAR